MSKRLMMLCLILSFLFVELHIAAADTKDVYYYNPDGGQYIHADPQCDTISSKYWPIMEQISLDCLKEPEYKTMRLCATCCVEKNTIASFFRGKKEVEGIFDLTEKAAENMKYYTDCCQYALSFLIDDIGDPIEQYRILAEDEFKHWGYPDEGDVPRDMAIAIAYAALQEYIGIEDDVLFQYYAEPWLDVVSYPYHEWMVRINRAVSTYQFYNSHGYYFFINADNGLITKIRRY